MDSVRPGRANFGAKLRRNLTLLVFTLTYSGMEGGTVTQALIPDFAEEHVGGCVIPLFCGGPE